MKILHISAECYPAAKTGGLGDVVGSLPKYQKILGATAEVIIPKYGIPWIRKSETEIVHQARLLLGSQPLDFTIERVKSPDLGFPFLYVNVPALFDRNGIYRDEHGFFGDEFQRMIAFNKALLQWICDTHQPYDILHCHDHHTGMIPFFMGHVEAYQFLKDTPSVFTIHNGKYQGRYTWDLYRFLPHFNPSLGGLIEWDDQINFLAAGIKNCWKLTTVSESYLAELRQDSDGLEWLFNNEKVKSQGILNGIDNEYWNPQSDPFLHYQLKSSVNRYKEKNKNHLSEILSFDANKATIAFIGRLVYEKGIDFLIHVYDYYLSTRDKNQIQLIILGTGADIYEHQLRDLKARHPDNISLELRYDEGLAHQIYAGSDFLFMPSRVEPCGLNQFYSLRYGTIPIVRQIGGLADSVSDYHQGGNGIVFPDLNSMQGLNAIENSIQLYQNKEQFLNLRSAVMEEDHSWENSAKQYMDLYQSIIK